MLFSFDFCPFPLCTQATNARRTDSILLSSYHSGLQNTMSDTLRRVLRSRACLSHEYIVCTFVQSAAPLHRNFPYFMNPVHCFRALFCVYYRCTKEKAKQKKKTVFLHFKASFLSLPPHSFPILCFHISLSLLYGAPNLLPNRRAAFLPIFRRLCDCIFRRVMLY